MSSTRFSSKSVKTRPLTLCRRLILAVAGLTLTVAVLSGSSASATGAAGTGCGAHRPNYIEGQFEVAYKAGCSGHDERSYPSINCAHPRGVHH